jgi:hypothetical protein
MVLVVPAAVRAAFPEDPVPFGPSVIETVQPPPGLLGAWRQTWTKEDGAVILQRQISGTSPPTATTTVSWDAVAERNSYAQLMRQWQLKATDLDASPVAGLDPSERYRSLSAQSLSGVIGVFSIWREGAWSPPFMTILALPTGHMSPLPAVSFTAWGPIDPASVHPFPLQDHYPIIGSMQASVGTTADPWPGSWSDISLAQHAVWCLDGGDSLGSCIVPSVFHALGANCTAF